MTVSARTRQLWALLDWLGTLMFLAQQLRSQLDDIIPLSMDTARYMLAGQVAAVRRRPCWPACKIPAAKPYASRGGARAVGSSAGRGSSHGRHNPIAMITPPCGTPIIRLLLAACAREGGGPGGAS